MISLKITAVLKTLSSRFGFRRNQSVIVDSSTNSDPQTFLSENDGVDMGRRGFPNPLSSIKSFSTKKQPDREKNGQNMCRDAVSTRKDSIDHTVLTRESNGRMNEYSHLTDVASLGEDVDNTNKIAASTNISKGCMVIDAGPSITKFSITGNASSFQDSSCHEEICDDLTTYRENLVQNNFHHHSSSQITATYSPSSKRPSPDVALQARIEAVEIQQALLGENHPDVIFALSSLAKLHQRRGDYREASSIMRDSQKRSFLAKTVSRHHHSVDFQPQNDIPREISFSI